jgi:hypothetical protein
MSDDQRREQFPGALEFHVYRYRVRERYHPVGYQCDPERVLINSVTLHREPVLSTIKVEDGYVTVYSEDGEQVLARYSFGTPDADYDTLEQAMEAAKERLEQIEILKAAQWSTSYINDLPDSAFLWIEPGGTKDQQGKTTPRSLRHLPYKDAQGNIDLPHLRNAIRRAQDLKDKEGQPISDAMVARLEDLARDLLEQATQQTAALEPEAGQASALDQLQEQLKSVLESLETILERLPEPDAEPAED